MIYKKLLMGISKYLSYTVTGSFKDLKTTSIPTDILLLVILRRTILIHIILL